MSGSFWKFSNGFTSLSNISNILENYSVSQGTDEETHELLIKILDENDLLQELLSNNSTLLEFLREEKVLGMLVELIITEGKSEDELNKALDQLHIKNNEDEEKREVIEEKQTEKDEDTEEDSDEKTPYEQTENDEVLSQETAEEVNTRRATLAAEVLSADVWSLTDTVMESTPHLNQLWSILDSEEPLSINLSTYFMKIMEHLLDMKCDEMVTYLIDNQPNLVRKFMNHLSNPPLIDFLLKLISTDKPDNSTGIIDFLQRQDFITQLIEALDLSGKEESEEEFDIALVKQSSAADFLKALITISANSTTDNSTIGPNELTRELVSYDQMSKLCAIMLKGGYNLSNGVGIIIEIIRKNNSDYDILPVLYITLESHPPTGRDPIYLGHLLKVFADKINEFNKLLTHEAHINNKLVSRLKTPFGDIEPLGFERFKICELIAELLHCSNMALLNDNKGFEVVRERDELRNKMKEYDPVSFKYNEIIVLPGKEEESDHKGNEEAGDSTEIHYEPDDIANDTIDSFNCKIQEDSSSLMQNSNSCQEDEEEQHANANLTEEQIRANPVIGDFLKIALYDTQIITHITKMFYKFSWNNFLHNVVFDIVQQILNGSMDIGFNKFLAIDLFQRADITNKIIEGQSMCTEYEKANNGLRLGFMGHLTLIAEEVVKFIQLYPANTLSEVIDKNIQDKVWEDYVNNVLYDTREKYNAILGGAEDDDIDDTTHTFEDNTDDISNENYNSGLLLDPSMDHDIVGAFDEALKSSENGSEEQKDSFHALHSNSSDESSEEEDDYFTNYMSQQLTNSASTDLPPHNLLDAKTATVADPSADYDQFDREMSANGQIDIDNDDYIDPHDDGLSYKKVNSLYDSEGTLINITDRANEEVSSDDSSSSSGSEEEYFDDDDKVKNDDYNGNELTRAKSKS